MENVNQELIKAFQTSFMVAAETMLISWKLDFDKSKLETPNITIDKDKVIKIPGFLVYAQRKINITEPELKNFKEYLYNHLDTIMPEL